MNLLLWAEALVQVLVILVFSGHGDFADPAKESEAVILDPDSSPEKAEQC